MEPLELRRSGREIDTTHAHRATVREIENELADVRLHLAFAAKLVDAANTGNDQRRELEALLAVMRSYRTIVVYDVEGRERVVAVDRRGRILVAAALLRP